MNTLKKASKSDKSIQIRTAIHDFFLLIQFFLTFYFLILVTLTVVVERDIFEFFINFCIFFINTILLVLLIISEIHKRKRLFPTTVTISAIFALIIGSLYLHDVYAMICVAGGPFISAIINTLLWHLVFHHCCPEDRATKIVVLLTVAFLLGLANGWMWAMGGWIINPVTATTVWVPAIFYVVWCVWREKHPEKFEENTENEAAESEN